jgi:hypothetical protein
MVNAIDIPRDSEISRHLAGAFLSDAFEVPVDGRHRSALEIYLDAAAKTPSWIGCLMTLRNRAVALVGLKDLGHMNNIDAGRMPESYRVGDRVGIFTILFLSEREVIFVESDKHLDAKVSLCRRDGDRGTAAVMTTVIHVHNLLGYAYMFAVWPVHKLMVPSLLARAA